MNPLRVDELGTSFDHIYTNIFHTSIDLLFDEIGRDFVDGVDALSVLSC